MKTTTIYAILSLLIIWPLSSFASGNVKQDTRTQASFDRINVGSAFTVYLSQGTEQSVIVETEDKYVEKIHTTVKDGKLYIELKDLYDRNQELKTLNIYITIPEIKSLEATDAVSIKMQTLVKSKENVSFKLSGASDVNKLTLDCKKMDLHISGASKMNLILTSDEADINVSGASKLTIGGKIGLLNMNGSGVSKIDAKNLTCVNENMNTAEKAKLKK